MSFSPINNARVVLIAKTTPVAYGSCGNAVWGGPIANSDLNQDSKICLKTSDGR